MKFLKNIGWVTLAQIIAGAGAFFYTLLTAHFLGLAEFGLFQAIMGIFSTLAVFHLPLYFASVHLVASAPAEKRDLLLASLLHLALKACVIVLILFAVLAFPAAQHLHARGPLVVWVCGLLVASNALLTIYYGALQAHRKFVFFAGIKVAEVSLTLLAGMAAMRWGLGAVGAILGYAISMTLMTLYFSLTTKLPQPNVASKALVYSEGNRLLKLTGILFFMLALENLPAIFARLRFTPEISGYFGALYNLRSMVWAFSLAITLTFYAHLLGGDDAKQLRQHTWIILGLLGSGAIVCAWLLHTFVFHTLYGRDFWPAATFLPYYFTSVVIQMLTMQLLIDKAGRNQLNLAHLLPAAIFFILLIIFTAHSIPALITCQIAACCLAGFTVFMFSQKQHPPV